MARKRKEHAWFGCAVCLREPPPSEKSNDSWVVHDTNVPCAICGTIMKLHLGEPPIEVINARKIRKA